MSLLNRMRANRMTQARMSESWRGTPFRIKILLGLLVLTTTTIGMAHSSLYGSAIASGSLSPTATQSAALIDHGRTLYLTPHERGLIRWLTVAKFASVIATLGTAFHVMGFLDHWLIIFGPYVSKKTSA